MTFTKEIIVRQYIMQHPKKKSYMKTNLDPAEQMADAIVCIDGSFRQFCEIDV